jgi:K+-sensing histidine kinase KdpD
MMSQLADFSWTSGRQDMAYGSGTQAWEGKLAGYLISVASVVIVGLIFWPVYDQLHGAAGAFVLLLLVLLVALKWGTGPAITVSFLSTAVMNFFFVGTPLKLEFVPRHDFVALGTFLVASILVGQLSAREQRKTKEAQRLYEQLRDTFEQSSKLEAIRQTERLKSALLDAVTHDLRTPLTAIMAAATALTKSRKGIRSGDSELASGLQEEFLTTIVDESDRLNRFIEGMLELAKVQAGNFEESASTDSLEEIIGAALARADKLLKHHTIKCICEDDLTVASASPRAIAQVIYSILENAVRYAPRGSEIIIMADRTGDQKVTVAVEDDGPGIPLQYRRAVFGKFFRLPTQGNSATGGPGLGLGLAVARGIVEAHGGRIWIEDKPIGGNGARLVFTLPTRECPRSLVAGLRQRCRNSSDEQPQPQPLAGCR